LDFWLLCRKISLSGAEIAAHVSVKEDELMRTDDCEIRILICCHLEEDHFWKFYSSKSNSPELECNTIASAKELSGTRLLAHRLTVDKTKPAALEFLRDAAYLYLKKRI
jgi:hypothetical protein